MRAARRAHAKGALDAKGLREVEDDAIRHVVTLQENLGLHCASDGEFRRTSSYMDFIHHVRGIERADEQVGVAFKNAEGATSFTSPALRVADRVGIDETIFADAFTFLDSCVTTATPKLTIPSPSMVHSLGGDAAIDPEVYPDAEEFWHDLSAAYAEEIRGLAELGCTYLQLDDPSFAYLNDPVHREMVAARGDDASHQHLRYIEHINAAIKDRPAGMTITTHSCRGNVQSCWTAEGGYDFVAEALFSELDVDGFFLEFDDDRSGSFEPLRFVPAGKVVVLGLVSTKRGVLENKDDLKRRIEEASEYVPLEQLCLSPQCGFASTVEGNCLTFDEEIAKLQLVIETAQEVWG